MGSGRGDWVCKCGDEYHTESDLRYHQKTKCIYRDKVVVVTAKSCGFESIPEMMEGIIENSFKPKVSAIDRVAETLSDMGSNAVMIQTRADELGTEKYIDYVLENYFDKDYEEDSDLSYLYHKGKTLTFMCKPHKKEFYISDSKGSWRVIKPTVVELMIVLVMEGE